MSDVTTKRIFEGVTLVIIGVILLMNTTGALPWSVWLHVLSLWPLLLIAVGIDIVAKGIDAEWLRIVSSVLLIGGLLFGAFVLPVGDTAPGFGGLFGTRGVDFDIVETAGKRIASGSAVIQGGVGSYSVSDGDELVRVSGRSPHGEPAVSVVLEGTRALVDVMGPADRVWVPGVRGSSRVDVRLSRDVIWDLELDTGVVDLDADLSGLVIRSVEARSGVSQVTLTLGDIPSGVNEVPVSVRGGVTNFTIRIPESVPARIEADAGLTNISVDRDIPRVTGEGRIWMTPGFESDGGYDIRFEAGVSNVEVKTY